MTPATTRPLTDAELAGRLRVAVGLLVRWLRQRDPGQLSPATLSALITVEAAVRSAAATWPPGRRSRPRR